MKHNYRLMLAYDGTAYQGWQRQKTTPNTIQETMEHALCAVLGEPTKITGSGRTDAGVHAEAMAAHFFTEQEWEEQGFLQKISAVLPEDIRVWELREMPLTFHSRLSAKGKIYRYQIDTREKAGVFRRKYAYPHAEKLNVAAMRAAAEQLTGTHDFSAFTTDKTKDKSKVRTIWEISFTQTDGLLCIRFRGNGFLYNMVRILTGTLIEVGDGRRSVESVSVLLEEKKRSEAGFLAPAQGLFLENVLY